MGGFRSTKLHINAIIALVVLLVMFGAVACLAHTEIENGSDAATMQSLVALMGAAIGGVVYVVKQFASAGNEDDGKPDANGKQDH